MALYLFRRFIYMIMLVWVVSGVSFLIIQLPAGDYVDRLKLEYKARGEDLEQADLENLRFRFGLDQPAFVQYLSWAGNILQGDLGWSFSHEQPVTKVIGDRIGLTVAISIITLLFTYLLAIPIGIYSATHQYSIGDYVGMFVGFLGRAIPNFLLALILIYFFLNIGAGKSVGGLFSKDFVRAPWSVAKFIDFLKHLPLPIFIIGTAATAGLIRTMRATLLDELGRQYVITARAKGLHETKLVLKYPVRVALNPMASTIGWLLPEIVSGSVITAMVLNLPTVGPRLFSALLAEDMFLASSLLFFLTALTVVGTFISDMALVIVDPRIRFTERET